MRAEELIEILKELPGDANVVIAVVDPVDADSDEIALKRFDIDVLLPDAEDGEAWIVVGEEEDLEAFLDAYEDGDDDEDDDDDDDDDDDKDDKKVDLEKKDDD